MRFNKRQVDEIADKKMAAKLYRNNSEWTATSIVAFLTGGFLGWALTILMVLIGRIAL